MASKIIAYPNSSGLQLVPDSSGGLEIYVNGTTLVAAISAAGVFTTSLSSADTTTYMAASTLLNGSAALCNTGSIGAAGQVWEITGVALIGASDNSATVAGVTIYDGTTYIARGGGVAVATANWPVTSVCRAVATLTGPTTFTLYGTGNAGNTYAFQAGYGLGSTNTASFISARRIK